MSEVYERRWYGDRRIDEPEPVTTVPVDAEASYEQWIGLLYACAVFRGVLPHPVKWP